METRRENLGISHPQITWFRVFKKTSVLLRVLCGFSGKELLILLHIRFKPRIRLLKYGLLLNRLLAAAIKLEFAVRSTLKSLLLTGSSAVTISEGPYRC